eukprot:g4013.t1
MHTPASTLFIGVGQCGIQVSDSFWQIAGGYLDNSSSPRSSSPPAEKAALFNERTLEARCVLVDTEPKVIDDIVTDRGKPWFSEKNTVVDNSGRGRGNNWALGASVAHSGELLERAMDRVRFQVEGLDRLSGAVVAHSLGGGTGS